MGYIIAIGHIRQAISYLKSIDFDNAINRAIDKKSLSVSILHCEQALKELEEN